MTARGGWGRAGTAMVGVVGEGQEVVGGHTHKITGLGRAREGKGCRASSQNRR